MTSVGFDSEFSAFPAKLTVHDNHMEIIDIENFTGYEWVQKSYGDAN
jgi:hypothetical protein